MKQRYLKLCLLTLLAALCCAPATSATVKIGKLYYNLDTTTKTAEVTYYDENTSKNETYVSGDITIPSRVTYEGNSYSVTSIGNSAFRDCTSLTSVKIPNSVTSIGECAFYYCTALRTAPIPNSVTEIRYEAFNFCESLTSVTIPNSVSTLGKGAFGYCTNLREVTISNNVDKISDGAFEYCTKLSSVTIPNSVTEIGALAFSCCPLRSVVIPNAVTKIGYEAFMWCDKLTTVTIGGSVELIDKEAFYLCQSLEKIYSLAEIPPSVNVPFWSDTYENATLYVPAGNIQDYKTAFCWKHFKNIKAHNMGGVEDIVLEKDPEITGYYNLYGIRADEPWDGVNIIVYSDGSRLKVVK